MVGKFSDPTLSFSITQYHKFRGFYLFFRGGGGWILFQLIDPNLEHTIRIRIKTKGIDMKSKLIGGLKKIFLPKKRRERVRMFQKLGKYSL